MTVKEIAALLTSEEKGMVEVANTVSANLMFKLLEKLAKERAKVCDLEQKLRKRNGNG